MQVKLLLGSAEFMESLARDVQSAKDRVWVQCLTFEADGAGKRLGELFMRSAAADRRLLIDEYTKYVMNDRFLYSPKSLRDEGLQKEKRETFELLERLEASSTKVRWTHPIGWKIYKMSARNHKKIVVVDDVVYIGGINFSDHNFAWHDFMVRIEEPDWVQALVEDFASSWDSKEATYGWKGLTGGGLLRFPGRNRSLRESEELLSVFRNARSSIFIESPYLSEPIFSLLVEKSNAGVKVDLVLPKKNNWAAYDDYTRACLAGSEIQVHFFPEMTHLKSALIDEEQLWLGSANFEYFGLHLHEELLARFDDKALISTFISRVRNPDVAASQTVPAKKFSTSNYARARVEVTFRLFNFLNRFL